MPLSLLGNEIRSTGRREGIRGSTGLAEEMYRLFYLFPTLSLCHARTHAGP